MAVASLSLVLPPPSDPKSDGGLLVLSLSLQGAKPDVFRNGLDDDAASYEAHWLVLRSLEGKDRSLTEIERFGEPGTLAAPPPGRERCEETSAAAGCAL